MKPGRPVKFTATEAWCPTCNALLPRSMFGVCATRLAGVQGYCLTHQRERVGQWNRRKTIKSLLSRAEKRREQIVKLEAEARTLEAQAAALGVIVI